MATIPSLPMTGAQLHETLTALAGEIPEAGASPDVRTFATYADALAYSTANPAAIVFSEQEAP